MSSTFKYRAFLTYAHKDEDKARWLRKKLEDFRVPKHLIGRNTPVSYTHLRAHET